MKKVKLWKIFYMIPDYMNYFLIIWAGTVSYTHLFVFYDAGNNGLIKKIYVPLSASAVYNDYAVSYTHLDVYKRQ